MHGGKDNFCYLFFLKTAGFSKMKMRQRFFIQLQAV